MTPAEIDLEILMALKKLCQYFDLTLFRVGRGKTAPPQYTPTRNRVKETLT